MNPVTLFTNKTLVFDSATINVEQVPLPIPRAQFGILNLTAISAPSNGITLDLLFSVDQSGSMSELCSDGRTKMQHITHTLKNMVYYFRDNPHINVFITIDSFDDHIYNIVQRSAITPENLNEIIAKVELIVPKECTNIEAALIHAERRVQQMRADFPSHTICHVFMTDGVATTGEQHTDKLTQLVNKNITSAFIGFGIEHDGVLLSSLGSGKNSAYYFIDQIENAGLVYGEILHGLVYRFVVNVRLTVVNGYIYDFKNNAWVQELYTDDIVSDSNKTYHIASHHVEECAISLTGNRLGEASLIHYTIMRDYEVTDLSKFLYRQRTLQHLFAVNTYLKEDNNKNIDDHAGHRVFAFVTPTAIQPQRPDDYVVLRNKLRDFIKEMKQFMTERQLMNDNFMNNLCDDIYICYRTFGTKYGTMYATSRQASQGHQRSYAVSHTPEDVDALRRLAYPPPPILRRNGAAIRPIGANIQVDVEEDLDKDMPKHSVSGFNNTPYRTPSSARVMRALSSGAAAYDSGNENDEEESQLP